MSKPEVYCPKCKWKPIAGAYWMCLPVCGTEWDTFATGGVCPTCGEVFEYTQCLRCEQLSPHKDWYHFPDGERTTQQREGIVTFSQDCADFADEQA